MAFAGCLAPPDGANQGAGAVADGDKRAWRASVGNDPHRLFDGPIEVGLAALGQYPAAAITAPLWARADVAALFVNKPLPLAEMAAMGQLAAAPSAWHWSAAVGAPALPADADREAADAYTMAYATWAETALLLPNAAHATYDAIEDRTYTADQLMQLVSDASYVTDRRMNSDAKSPYVNAGALHVALINGIGRGARAAGVPYQLPLVAEFAVGEGSHRAVTSLPVLGYATQLVAVTGDAANDCLLGVDAGVDGYGTNGLATELYRATTTVAYAQWHGGSTSETYTYVLEVANGAIIGGEFCAAQASSPPRALRRIHHISPVSYEWSLYVTGLVELD